MSSIIFTWGESQIVSVYHCGVILNSVKRKVLLSHSTVNCSIPAQLIAPERPMKLFKIMEAKIKMWRRLWERLNLREASNTQVGLFGPSPRVSIRLIPANPKYITIKLFYRSHRSFPNTEYSAFSTPLLQSQHLCCKFRKIRFFTYLPWMEFFEIWRKLLKFDSLHDYQYRGKRLSNDK